MRRRVIAAACLVAAALLVAWIARNDSAGAEHGPAPSPAERLLGPIADLAATLEWVRFDVALGEGRHELAEARAELALALAPGDPSGWIYYARHLIYDRASRLREPDMAARERWVRAGLEVLARGERESRKPGRVAFARAIVFVSMAPLEDADRPLSISREEAWLAAAEAFERAAQHAEPLAAEAAAGARRAAAEARREAGR